VLSLRATVVIQKTHTILAQDKGMVAEEIEHRKVGDVMLYRAPSKMSKCLVIACKIKAYPPFREVKGSSKWCLWESYGGAVIVGGPGLRGPLVLGKGLNICSQWPSSWVLVAFLMVMGLRKMNIECQGVGM